MARNNKVHRYGRKKKRAKKKIPVISLFSGAMGLDLGLEKAGFEIVLAVECDPQAILTIKRNRPNLTVIDRKIEDINTSEILRLSKLKRGGSFVVSGGPSCQSFSTAGQRASIADPRGSLFRHFLRVVKEAQPKFFIMENVKGMLSAAVVHRPLGKRGPGFKPLQSRERLGSAFRVITDALRELNYYVVFDVLNAADYGVPQTRERLFFIGSRDGQPISTTPPTHAEKAPSSLRPWATLRQAIGDLSRRKHVSCKLGPDEKRYLKRIPEGGNWRHLPVSMQKLALGKAFVSWGGRSGFLRRLSWNRPSPSLTTRPDCKATMLCHPTLLRTLSPIEYARIQQFPKHWKFEGTMTSQYRQIGNAVPVGLGKAVGLAVAVSWNRRSSARRKGVVESHNAELLRRLARRPVTLLNPPRMRGKKKGARHVTAWAKTQRAKRTFIDLLAASTVGLRKAA